MSFQPAIASISLGHPTIHPIERRLKQAAAHGFKLVEIVEEDLNTYARQLDGRLTDLNKIKAAEFVKELCDNLEIRIIVLQPFWFYEGLLDREEHRSKIEKLRLWMKLAKVLACQIVQIPTNWRSEGTTGDIDAIVKDLVEMAEIGLAQDPVVSFAYEGVAWGTHIDTWQGTWEVIKRVNKPNFGLCLDTYHIAARVWGDPTARNCKNLDGDTALEESMKQLIEEVDVRKIFYVQPGDAELLGQPLVAGHPFHLDTQLPRMSWSRNARLFAFEEQENGCLPIGPILDAIVNGLKFKGYISLELFSRKLFDPNPEIPAIYARRGMDSWNTMLKKLK